MTTRDDDNRLVPLIAVGAAPRTVFTVLAEEERLIVRSDWRSLLHLAARSEQPAVRHYFSGLAAGEELALARLAALTEALGLTGSPDDYRPRPDCQAYPHYFAWLALNAEPTEVAVAMTANFAAWGRYCAAIAKAMRAHYGFADAACGFFDLFAQPLPDDDAVAAVQAGIDDKTLNPARARRYAVLFQSYELQFWNSID